MAYNNFIKLIDWIRIRYKILLITTQLKADIPWQIELIWGQNDKVHSHLQMDISSLVSFIAKVCLMHLCRGFCHFNIRLKKRTRPPPQCECFISWLYKSIRFYRLGWQYVESVILSELESAIWGTQITSCHDSFSWPVLRQVAELGVLWSKARQKLQ